jgi:anti-anti-sigma regulatory factor
MKVPGLTIRELADRQVLVLAIEGEIPRDMLDLALEAALGAIRRCTRYVVAELSRAERISSTLAGLLGYYSKHFPTQGMQLLGVRGPARIMALLAVAGADRVIPFFDTLDQALEHVGLAQPSGSSEAI